MSFVYENRTEALDETAWLPDLINYCTIFLFLATIFLGVVCKICEISDEFYTKYKAKRRKAKLKLELAQKPVTLIRVDPPQLQHPRRLCSVSGVRFHSLSVKELQESLQRDTKLHNPLKLQRSNTDTSKRQVHTSLDINV